MFLRVPRIRNLSAVVAAVAIATAVSPLEAATRWELLESIHAVENPRNSTKQGRHGELGAYQFRPQTWKMHTRKPFQEAVKRTVSDEVAVLHYEWIKARLEKSGVETSPYNIALAWNAGVSAVVNGRVPHSSHDYARRVSNLAADLGTRRMAAK